jgi:hypothetical protein
MFGMNGISLPTRFKNILDYSWLESYNIDFNGVIGNGIIDNHRKLAVLVAMYLILILLFPNTQQFMRQHNYKLYGLKLTFVKWRPTLLWIGFISIILIVSIINISGDSEFIYFNF